jgi:RHS repeat-associated protein
VTPLASPGAGRLQTADGPLGSDAITYSYDELGRLIGRSINGVSQSASYDTLGRLSGETNVLGAFSYGYDGVTDRVLNVAYPNGESTTYSYFGNSGDHRLQQILNRLRGGATLSRFQYDYDANGVITSWTQQTDTNPVKVYSLDHDPTDQLLAATLSTASPPVILKRYRYAYDKTGNRIAEQVDDALTGASYNNLNALTALQAGGALNVRGTLNKPAMVSIQGKPATVDAANDFQGRAQIGPGTTSVTVAATDYNGNTRTNTYQATATGGGGTLSYDANGNLTSDGVRTFEWDGANRLTAVSQGTHRSEFSYDGWGHRVRLVEKDNESVTADRRFLWCGMSICEERDGTGASVVRSFFGLGVHESGAGYFYAMDHLGSVRELTDANGTIRVRYDYDPYGRATKVVGDKDSAFTYAGLLAHGPSGLSLAFLRAYDPVLGRWISQDPIGFGGGLNLYAYVHGNPVNAIDPLGLNAQLAPIPPTEGYREWYPVLIRGGVGATAGGGWLAAGGALLVAIIVVVAVQQVTGPVPPNGQPTPAPAPPPGPSGLQPAPPPRDPITTTTTTTSNATKPDLRQFEEAVRRIEKRCCKILTPDQRRQLHDEITKQGLTLEEIVEIGVSWFCPGR